MRDALIIVVLAAVVWWFSGVIGRDQVQALPSPWSGKIIDPNLFIVEPVNPAPSDACHAAPRAACAYHRYFLTADNQVCQCPDKVR